MLRLFINCDSHHLSTGGRQVDGAIASLDALARIGLSEKVRAAQDSGKFTVLFDSGIRTGSDIIKALALGAQAVLRKPVVRLALILSDFHLYQSVGPTSTDCVLVDSREFSKLFNPSWQI